MNYMLSGMPQHKIILPVEFLLNHMTDTIGGLIVWEIKNDWENPNKEMAQYFEKTVLPLI